MKEKNVIVEDRRNYMNEIVPMNDYLLVKVEEKKVEGIYFGENKDKPIVIIKLYEMIPHGDTED